MRLLILFCAVFSLVLPPVDAMADLFVKKKEDTRGAVETVPDYPSGEAEQTSPPAQPDGKRKTGQEVFVPQKSKEMSAQQIDRMTLMHTQEIGAYCVGSWQSQPCMKALASTNLTVATLYSRALERKGQKKMHDPLLQGCAASTAAVKREVPAYAMKSAMTECANAISDISEATKVKPNPTHFQLLVEPIFCLGGEPRCGKFEELLRQIVAKSLEQQQTAPQAAQ